VEDIVNRNRSINMKDDFERKPKDKTMFGLPGSKTEGGTGEMKQGTRIDSEKTQTPQEESPFAVKPPRRSSYPPPKFPAPSPAPGIKPIPPVTSLPSDSQKKAPQKTILGIPAYTPPPKTPASQQKPEPAPAKQVSPLKSEQPITPKPIADASFKAPSAIESYPQATEIHGKDKGEQEVYAPTMMAYVSQPIQPQQQPPAQPQFQSEQPISPPQVQPQQPKFPSKPPPPPQQVTVQTPTGQQYHVPVISQPESFQVQAPQQPPSQYTPQYAQGQGFAPVQGGVQPVFQSPPPGGGTGFPAPPSPAPEKKKKNPIIFVAIGCGALLFIVIIIGILIGSCYICRSKSIARKKEAVMKSLMIENECKKQMENIGRDPQISPEEKEKMIQEIETQCEQSVNQAKKALGM